LRIPSAITDDDTYVNGLIASALDIVEKITNRKIITQTWEYYLDQFPEGRSFYIPFGSLQSITSIKYYDAGGTLLTFDSANYQYEINNILGIVQLYNLANYPVTQPEKLSAIIIKFICGYGAAASVPVPIKQAILMLVSVWYENREPVSEKNMVNVPMTFDFLLNSFRIYSFQ
jgi:uncharacterized phiE125 gp8 family phage protein